jgi:hypothetical protein
MARKETLTLNHVQEPCFNVCEVVGIGPKARNNKGDVMVVQAMFRTISGVFQFDCLGMKSRDFTPDVTGYFDLKTKNTLRMYQHFNRDAILSEDGLIHPASYED